MMMTSSLPSNLLLKTGASSVVLGDFHYKGFVSSKPGKLVKVTRIIPSHNELTYLSEIKKITDYEKYYAIPDDEIMELKPSDSFYKHVEKLTKEYAMTIYGKNLSYFYIDYAGQFDLLDSIDTMVAKRDYSIWSSVSKMIPFSKQILNGLAFLHDKKICHLDIKSENIMIDIGKNTYRIIDFGFASKEPFTEFVNNVRGTPGYFPKNFNGFIEDGLPTIYANDMNIVNGKTPMQKNPLLVYKIDAFCLGRVINFLYYNYNTAKQEMCSLFGGRGERKERAKIIRLIKTLTKSNVYERFTVKEVIDFKMI